jgi:hypothetical protein
VYRRTCRSETETRSDYRRRSTPQSVQDMVRRVRSSIGARPCGDGPGSEVNATPGAARLKTAVPCCLVRGTFGEWQNWGFAAVGRWKAAVRRRLWRRAVWIGVGGEGAVGAGYLELGRTHATTLRSPKV